MNTNDFCHWFKGFLDLENPNELNSNQLGIVKEHLELALKESKFTAFPSNYIYDGMPKFETIGDTSYNSGHGFGPVDLNINYTC